VAQNQIRSALLSVLSEMGVDDADVRLERPKDPTHGDVSTNVALTLAGRLKKAPRAIAEEIAEKVSLDDAGVSAVEIAGPGFLNFRLATGAVASILADIVREDASFGRSDSGAGQKVMVEFVSANPTGPLHLGHGRQAALGDTMAELLSWAGWDVSREYYYNDAGVQIERLAQSVWARYQQEHGQDSATIPEGGYQGDYVREIARDFSAEHGDALVGDDSAEALASMQSFAVAALRKEQDADLNRFGVRFDVYFLESSLYEDGRVEQTLAALRETGLVYEQEGAVWLRTTEFGDQKDRVMVKSDGSATYFLPDVAYHMDKWERGFKRVINVQGSDHHGTVARVRAGLQALGLPAGYPEYVLHQMVRVEQGGREVKFSKRSGSYTTLNELVQQVGADVTRYFFQMRKPEGHLVFDLDLALDQSDKNPVFKVKYAHARMCSIFARAGITAETISPEGAALGRLDTESERELIKVLGEFPSLVDRAADSHAPHLVCDYLEQLSGQVNSWYHAGNPSRNPELAVLVEDVELRAARLMLARAIQVVLRNGLTVLGIEAPERMDRAEAG
jgi:arginyl-tRNA synthetase